MTAAIFRAKFTVPSLPANYRPRRRLDDVWSRSSDLRLVQVTAGAGWGKTCFLAAHAQSCGDGALWYTLDELDRDPSVLAAHLAAACGLEPSSAPPLETLAGIVGELDRRRLLVLDDVQAMAGSEPARRFLTRLLRYLPSSCALVLSSREPVALPGAQLETRGQARRVTEADLGLTPDETRAQLQDRCGDDALALAPRVHGVTEGWPTAMEIVCQALQEAGPPERGEVLARLEAGGGRWFDFFAEEILADLDQETRRFLVRTAVLPHLEPGLCDELLQQTGSARRLQDLAHRNLFTQRVGPDSWRYHNLLRACLRRRLALELPAGELRRLHRRAAQLQVAAGEPEAAILDLARADDAPAALALLSSNTRELADTRRPETLALALDALPQAEVRRHAPALLVRGSLAHLTGRWDEAETDLRRAGRLQPKATVASQIQARLVRLHLQRGHFETCLRAGRRALAGGRNCQAADRGLILSSLGVAAASRGRLQQGADFLRQALVTARRRGDLALEGRCHYLLAANIHYLQGDLDTGLVAARQARDLYRELGRGDLACHAEGVLGFIHAGRGDLAEARQSSLWALQRAEAIGYRLIEGYARLTLGACELLSGDPTAATVKLSESLTIARELGEEALATWVHLELAEAAWRRGDLPRARQEATVAAQLAETRRDLFCHARALGFQGRLLADSRPERAAEVWDEAEAILRDLGARLEGHRLALWRAAAGLGDRPEEVLAAIRASDHGYLTDRLESTLVARLEAAVGAPEATEWQEPRGGGALDVKLLGPLEVVCDGRTLDPRVWRSRRARRLFNILLVHWPRPVPREQVMECLWPEADPRKSAVNLRQTVFRLRGILEPDGVPEPVHVLSDGEVLRLDLGGGSCDAVRFEESLTSARTARQAGRTVDEVDALERAVGLWRGAVLADTPYDRAVEDHAAALRLAFLRAAERLLELLAAAGRWDPLVQVARQALAEDPLHEAFARSLLLGLLRLGLRGEVLETYRRFEARLVRELDMLPSSRLKDLAEQAGRVGGVA